MIPLRNRRKWNRLLAVVVTAVAVVGTQFLGWEWGDRRLLPTLLGICVAILAVGHFIRARTGKFER